MHTALSENSRPVDGAAAMRIRQLSIWAQRTALLAIVLLVVTTAAMPLNIEWLDENLRREIAVGEGVSLAITPATRTIAYLMMLSVTAIFIFALWTAYRLFADYARGEIFTELAASRLSRIGWAVVAMSPSSTLVDTLSTIVLTINNPPGQRHVSITLDATDLIAIVGGLVLVAVGRIMLEATRVAEENRQFV